MFFEFEGVDFNKYISDMFIELKKNNLNYKEKLNEVEDILDKYPRLRKVIESDFVTELNKEECNALIEVQALQLVINDIESKEMFFIGAKEAYYYFKRISIIKD